MSAVCSNNAYFWFLSVTPVPVEYSSSARNHRFHLSAMPVASETLQLGIPKYEKAVSALDTYFKPQTHSTFERSLFWRTVQLPNEMIEQYITKLRQREETCELGNRNAIDERKRNQVVDKCLNHSLRRKLLEKGKNVSVVWNRYQGHSPPFRIYHCQLSHAKYRICPERPCPLYATTMHISDCYQSHLSPWNIVQVHATIVSISRQCLSLQVIVNTC
jgi:hypothetical protein